MSALGLRVGEDMAVTGYAGWDFHSLCRVGGVVLAADGQGLCRLGGDTDDGRPIAAVLDMPPIRPDPAAPVRIRDVRVRGRMRGGMRLRLAADGGQPRRMTLGPVAEGGEGRFPVGRDGAGRVWSVGLENKDGGDFVIEELTLGHVALDRR